MGISASDFYATTQSDQNKGDQRCHWCGSACTRRHPHGEPPPGPFERVNFRLNKVPSSPYACRGCWLFRRPRQTVLFPDGTFRDGQSPRAFAAWMTDEECLAVRPADYPLLYPRLLAPPRRFVLAFLRDEGENHLQLMLCNDHEAVTAGTPLAYTVDGIPSAYTLFELEECLRPPHPHHAGWGPDGKSGGVRQLAELLGPYDLGPDPAAVPPVTPQGGRPRPENTEGGRRDAAAKRARRNVA